MLNDLLFHVGSQKLVKVLTLQNEEEEKQINTTLKNLDKTFSVLMVAVRSSLDHKLQHQQLVLVDFIRWIEHRMKWVGELKDTVDLDEVFKKLHPYFDFIDCELIVDMSEQFLKNECFGEDNKNLVSELKEHMLKAETLRCSSTVKELKNKLRQIYSPQLINLSNMPTIQIMLLNPWNEATIGGLYLLIGHLLPHKSKQSILKYIEIDTGSVIIKYIVHESKADCLIAHAQGKLQFMRLIGIFGLTINGQLILNDDENMNFTFESALLEAAKTGHDEAVQFLLKFIKDVNHCNNKGRTALMLASKGGHEQVVQTLILAGAKPNIQDNNGYTALMLACDTNSYNMVNYLLQSGANPDIQSDNGDTAIIIACQNNHSDIVKLLLQFNADPLITTRNDDTALTVSVHVNSIEIVEMLLDKQPENQKASLVVTALTTASRYGHSQLIISLLVHLLDYFTEEEFQLFILSAEGDYISTTSHIFDSIVDVNCTLVNDITPLMIASSCGHTETVQVLLQAGANVHSTDNDGYSPLVYAITGHKSLQVIEQLLKAGAQPNVFINDQSIADKVREEVREDIYRLLEQFNVLNTTQKEKEEEQQLQYSSEFTISIIEAAKIGNTEVVKLLLKENTDVNIQKEDGVTALMLASLNGHTQVVELLIKENADVNIQSKDGVTALMLASQNGHNQVVELLLKENADINIQKEDGVTALMLASQNGHTQVVELLLKENADVNIQGENGCTALMIASQNGHTQVVELLLKENADVNIHNKNGWTALTLASQNGHTQVVELLIKENADVNIQSKDGVTALMLASQNGHNQVVELLLKENADINIQKEDGVTALMLASQNGHTQVVELLLKENADVNIQNKNGWTALMIASENGHTQVVELLLKENADVNIQNKNGWTALMLASLNGHTQVVELLIKENTDVNIQNEDGWTALMLASQNGHTQVVELLLKENADANIQKEDGWAALMIASQNGHTQVVELLLKENADVNIQNKNGWTALMIASENGHTQVVELLLKENADVNIQNKNGWTALMIASENGHTQVVELLLKENADVNIQNKNGWTALMLASLNGHTQVVELLIKENTDVNIQNEDGWTALMIASQNGHTQVVELLQKENADVNIQNKDGVTALMVAIVNEHYEVVERLLQSKADPHIALHLEKIEITALLLAVLTGNRDIIKVLIDKSEPTTDEIENAVVISCYGGHPTLITFLSNKLPYLTNDQRELLDSCVKGDLGTVVMKTLDSPDTPLVLGLTPLMVVSSCGHDDIVDALIQAGADVNKQESYWRLSPLYFAIEGGKSTSIVEMLLENGANPNVIFMNKTPLDVANENEDGTIIELLIKYGGQTASHLQDTKQSSEQTIKSSSQTSSETMTIATSSLTISELINKANKKQTKRKRVPNFKSIFSSFTSHILNPTHTFKDISLKQDNKKGIKQNNKEEGQEDYLIPIIY